MRHERIEHTEQSRRAAPGLGAPAGVYLLDGGFHVAPLASGEALRMRERGALLVAALHFDAARAELLVAGGRRLGTAPVLLRPHGAGAAHLRLGPG
jgi:hypothetical protein